MCESRPALTTWDACKRPFNGIRVWKTNRFGRLDAGFVFNSPDIESVTETTTDAVLTSLFFASNQAYVQHQ